MYAALLHPDGTEISAPSYRRAHIDPDSNSATFPRVGPETWGKIGYFAKTSHALPVDNEGLEMLAFNYGRSLETDVDFDIKINNIVDPPGPKPPSVEQMVRDILEQAISDGLVIQNQDPQCMPSGDLVGVANLLNSYFKTCSCSAHQTQAG